MEDFKVLFSKEDLEKRITEMAQEIDEYYSGKEIIAVCVLKGAVFFATDLLRKMKTPLSLDFLRASSYEGTESTGKVNLDMEITTDIEGKDVLVVEDIADTGNTLKFLVDYLKSKNPKSLKVAVLLDKKERRTVEINLDYTGFVIPNKFVVGYGFDIDQKYRNMPYIGYVEN